jgi:uncharacterized Zn finger protein (UPF0148 family)
MKARNRNVMCPVCRVDIKEELDAIENVNQVIQNEVSQREDEKEDEKEEEELDEIRSEKSRDDLESAVGDSSVCQMNNSVNLLE